MSTLFVTGTGTDIGKTWICCELIRAWRGRLDIRCTKPVITGFDPGDPGNSDTGRLLEAQGLPLAAANIEATSPWRYRAALSADMAAAREGREVPFDALVEFSAPREHRDLNLIEGIGGVMAPLDRRRTVLDWIGRLDADVLLVAGSYLGMLSHTLTALSVLEGVGARIAAVAVSQSRIEPVATEETCDTLSRFSGGLTVVKVPRSERPAALENALADRLGLADRLQNRGLVG